jgi:alpha-glucosidase (family GH31 glycosyl hydrolase)
MSSAVQDQLRESGGTVTDERVRFQVLTPSLVRLEYSSSGEFEDRPTFFAVDREFDVPEFDSRVSDGWIEIDTDELLFRYERGSGPFDRGNTEVEPAGDLSPGPLNWNQRVCPAEQASATGTVTPADHRTGYSQTEYLTGFRAGEASWRIDPPPAKDDYTVTVRYALANVEADTGGSALVLRTADEERSEIALPAVDDWATAQATVTFDEETDAVSLTASDDIDCSVLIDYLVISGIGAAPPTSDSANLGGWYRDLDGQSEPVDMFDGLLSRNGWYLLDDTETALWVDDWIRPRSREDAYQDGYLFGYGHDYDTGIRDFRDLTGPAPLLPKWAFGNWFSRYYPYAARDYREEVLPTFRANRVPLDVLVVDTDWKAPKIPDVKGAGGSWSGWNWDEHLFPEPETFVDWADDEGLHLSLNVHPSVYHRDPKFDRADEIAGGLPEGRCVGPERVTCGIWDWSDPDHVESYFFLHNEFDDAGQDLWWFDWLADSSGVDVDGIPGDSWINSLYADRRRECQGRGFALSRIGANWRTDGKNSPGPWAEHRSTLHFTGDTDPTWEMLDFQTRFTVNEGLIGLPYVSHDIGSHTGGRLPPELYVRWIQSGVFQPVLRLHSVPGGRRLPWQYRGDASDVAADFLRLRHALVPYVYTLAREAHDIGLPIVRGMFLDYPESDPAHSRDGQYMFGDQLLVAPVGEPAEKGEETGRQFVTGARLQAERAEQTGGTRANAFYSEFSGESYVEGFTEEGAAVTWTLDERADADEYDLLIRYANHVESADESPERETLALFVDGKLSDELTFEPTEDWHSWETHRIAIEKSDDGGAIRLERTAEASGNVHVDFVALVDAGRPIPEPDAPDVVPPAEQEVWFPPGRWTDFFTGETYEGSSVKTLEVPLDQMPVFLPEGGIVPMQPYMDHIGQRPVDPLVVRICAGDDGSFELYEDEGDGPDYRENEYVWTPIRYMDDDGTPERITVGPATGSYPDHPTERGYRIEILDADRPTAVRVDGCRLDEVDEAGGGDNAWRGDDRNREGNDRAHYNRVDGDGWWYTADDRTLTVAIEATPTDRELTVAFD